MSNSVDNRVVELDFNTSKFERGVRKVLDGVARLKESLKFEDASQNFNQFEETADASFDKIGHGLDRLNKKFSTFSVAWMSIVNRVTSRAVDSFMNTINQIKTGGENRARNIEQASFMLEGMFSKAKNGAKMIEEIKKNAMDAVDSTAYGFDESAKAAAQFAASGVKAGKEMETTLKGIAGVAAMTSSSFTEVADIFTTAAGKGKVQADEFNRLAYKGLNARAELAKQLKISEEEVNELAKKGEIGFKTFANAMAKAYGEQAKKANETFDGALSNVKASLNRIGELWYTPHRENMRRTYVEEIEMFNKLKVVLRPVIGVFRRLDRLYSNFKIRTIHKITAALTAMGKVSDRIFKRNGQKGFSRGLRYLLHPIKQVVVAFQRGFDKVFKIREKLGEVFPIKQLAKSSKGNHKLVLDMANTILRGIKAFREFAHTMRFSQQGMENLTDAFAGIAAVGHIFITIISDIVKAINPTGKTIGNFVDLILAIAGAIGRVLQSFDKFITETAFIRGIFTLIGKVIGGVIKGISWLAGRLGKVLTSLKKYITIGSDSFIGFAKTIDSFFGGIKNFVSGKILSGIKNIGSKIKNLFSSIKKFGSSKFDGFSKFVSVLGDFGKKVKDFFSIKILDNLATFVKNIKELGQSKFGDLKIGESFKSILEWFKNLIKFDFSGFSLGGVKQQFEKLKPPIEKATSKMGEFISSLDAKGKIKKTSENLINSLKNIRKQGFGDFIKGLDIKGKAKSAGSGIANVFSSIWGYIKNADYKAIGDKIALGFGEFVGVLGKLKDGLVSFFKDHLADKFKNLGEIFGNFLKNVPANSMKTSAKVFDTFGKALGSFGVNVKDSLGSLGEFVNAFGGKWNNAILLIEEIIGGIIGAVLLFKQYKALKNITSIFTPFKEAGENVKSAAEGLKSFGSFLSGFGKSLEKGFDIRITRVESAATKLIKIAGAVALLSVSMRILADVDVEKVIPSLVAMGSMLAGLIVLARIFVLMFNNVDPDVFLKLTESLIILSGALGILAFTMVYLANNINENNIGWAIAGLAVVIGAIVILAKAISIMFTGIQAINVWSFVGLGIALLSMAEGINIISKSLMKLAEFSSDYDLRQATEAIFAIMIGLAAFTGLTSIGKGITKASFGMILIAIAVKILVNAIKKLAKAEGNLDKALEIFEIIALIMLTFAAVGTISMYALQSAAAVLAAAVSIGIVIKEIEYLAAMLSGENADAVWTAIEVIAGIAAFFLAFSVIGDKLGGVGLKQGGGIALMATAILEIVFAIALLAQNVNSVGDIFGAFFGLALGIIALAAAMQAFGKFANAKVSAEVILVGTAILFLAIAISVIASIPLAALAVAIIALAAGIGVLLIVMSAFSGVGVPMIAVAGALALVGVAVMFMGLGIKFLATGLASIIPLLLVFAAIPDEIIAGGLGVLKTILTSIGEALFALTGGLIAVAAGFFFAALGVGAFGIAIIIVAAGVLGLAAAVLALTGAIYVCANVIGADIKAVAAEVMGVLDGLFGWIVDGASGLMNLWKKFTGDIHGDLEENKKFIQDQNTKAQQEVGKSNKENAKKNMDEYAKGASESKDVVEKAQEEAIDPNAVIEKAKEQLKLGGSDAMGGEGWLGGVIEGAAAGELDPSTLTSMIDTEGLTSEFNAQGMDIGAALPEGIQSGFNGQNVDISSLMKNIGVQAGDTKEIKKSGKKQVNAYESELNNSKGPKKAAKNMASGAAKSADSEKSGFKTSGTNAAKGYAEGIREYAAKVAEEAAAMVKRAKKAAKDAQGEDSPAKLFIESGMYAALGYAVGIRRHSKASAEEAANMVSNTYSTMRDAIAKAQRFANDEINVDPTIRPVVDLSNVEAGAAQVSSMFGSGPFGLNIPSTGIHLAETIAADIQNGGKSDMASSINRLAKRLESVTETMNSRSMNNYFRVDGASDPNAFADAVSDRLRLKARAV